MKTQNLFFILGLCLLLPKSIEAQKSKSVDLVHAYFKTVDEGTINEVKNLIEWKNKTTLKTWGATFIHHFVFDQGKVVSFREISSKPWPIMVSASK